MDSSVSEAELQKSHSAASSAVRRASVAGVLTKRIVEPSIPGSVEAYQSIRPLVIRATTLSTKRAYRSFKLYSRLQRVSDIPYIPPFEDRRLLKYREQLALCNSFGRYVCLSAAIYPRENLKRYFIDLGVTNADATTEDICLNVIHRKGSIITHRLKAATCAPAWILIDDRYNKEIVLVIQGSSTTADWMTNLMCCPNANELGTHEGMERSAEHLDYELRTRVFEFLESNAKYALVLTGHSLGAGTATLLGVRWHAALTEPYKKRLKVVAFASPCVLPADHATNYSSFITSVIFGKDLVPRLSFQTARDILMILQALSRNLRDGKAPTRPTTASEADDSTVADEDEDEDELTALPQRRDSIMVSRKGSFGIVRGIDLYPDMMSETEREKEIEDLALCLATTNVDLPVTFCQLSTILRRREAELDKRRKAWTATSAKTWKLNWWQWGLWNLVKLCAGGCRSTEEYLHLNCIAEENKLIHDCITIVDSLKAPITGRTLCPGGVCILVIPKLHFMDAGITPPTLNAGQCCFVRYTDAKEIALLCNNPVWSVSAMREHSINHYIQAFAPDKLSQLPVESAIVKPADYPI